MSALNWLLIATNLLLGATLVGMAIRTRRANRRAVEIEREQREERERLQAELARLGEQHVATAAAVGRALSEVRTDIDASYQHLHDGDVLDRLAYFLQDRFYSARGRLFEVDLPPELAEQARWAGCRVGDSNLVSLADVLDFAWTEHRQARRQAADLFEVVKQPCGGRDHAAWMSKTLAIFERMCHRDKDFAVRQMATVIDAWRFCDADSAVREARHSLWPLAEWSLPAPTRSTAAPISLDFTGELTKLLRFTGETATAIRMYSAYSGGSPSDYLQRAPDPKRESIELMFLADSLHHFSELARMLERANAADLVGKCDDLLQNFEKYDTEQPEFGSRQAKPTFEAWRHCVRLADAREAINAIRSKTAEHLVADYARTWRSTHETT